MKICTIAFIWGRHSLTEAWAVPSGSLSPNRFISSCFLVNAVSMLGLFDFRDLSPASVVSAQFLRQIKVALHE